MKADAVRRWFGVQHDLTPQDAKDEREAALARIADIERDARLLADEAAAWRAVHGSLHDGRAGTTPRD